MNNIVRGYVNSFTHLTICVIALHLFAMKTLGKHIDDEYYYATFLSASTLLFYNVYALLGGKKLFAQRPHNLGIFLIIVSGIVSVFSFWQLHLHQQLASMVAGVVSMMYIFPSIQHKKLRDIHYAKIFFISFTYGATLVIIPLFDQLTPLTWWMALLVILFTLVLCLIFDIGDFFSDHEDVTQTIPMKFGIQMTKYIGYGLLVLCLLLTVYIQSFAVPVSFGISMIVTLALSAILINLAYPTRDKTFYLFWVDGLMLVPYIVYSVV